MKLKYIFTALVAAFALLFTGCTQEEERFLDEIRVSSSYIGIPAIGGQVDIKLTAVDSWKVTSDVNNLDSLYTPEWLTVTPMEGAAGTDMVVSFAADSASETREANLFIVCAGAVQEINVIQMTEKVELPITPISEILKHETGTFRAAGTVTNISNTTYGNWDLVDETGSIYIYGTLDASGAEKNFSSLGLENGDKVVVEGPLKIYNGTYELVNVTVISHEKSLISVDPSEVQIDTAAAGTFELAITAKVKGLAITPSVDWIALEGMKEDGDKVVVTFSHTANDEIIERTGTIEIIADGAEKSIAVTQIGREIDPSRDILAITIGDMLETSNEDNPMLYKVMGRVKEIKSEDYGNFTIQDGTGEIYVYGLTKTRVEKNDKSFGELGIKVNDVVTIIGNHSNYNGEGQMAGSYYVSHKSATVATVAEFLAAAESRDVYYELTGTVKNIKMDGDAPSAYGNFDLEDETGSVYVYGLCSAPTYKIEDNEFIDKYSNNKSFNELGIAEGTKVKIRSMRGSYNGTNQATDSYIIEVLTEGGNEGGGNEGGGNEGGGDTPAAGNGTLENPYSASEALALLNAGTNTTDKVYVKGIISEIDNVSLDYGNATYYISDDGTSTNALQIFRGKYFDNETFTSEDQIKVGDNVVVYGELIMYGGTTPEMQYGYIVSQN